ncbi:MAG TPA: MarR family transcriptional regulator [Spirochaetia bacterium]|nr:MarR family transcriptional regulator [Spirochaetia bacterium]
MKDQREGGFLLDKIHHLARRSLSVKLKEHGIQNLNAAQGRIMFVLWRTNKIPIQQLARETGLGKSTLTSMLDRLEKAGQIARLPSAGDRRQTMIVARKLNNEYMDQYERVSKEMNDLFYHDFLPGEIDMFESYLRRILSNLSNSSSPGK